MSSASGERDCMRRLGSETSCAHSPCLERTAGPVRRYQIDARLDPFSPPALQPLASIPLNPPPIAVYGSLLRRLAFPIARASIGLGYVGPHFHLRKST